jgi:hypothetical protein
MYNSPGVKKIRRYSVNKPRFICTIIVAAVILGLMLSLPSWFEDIIYPPYRIGDFSSEHLQMYFSIGEEYSVPWYYLAAIDMVERPDNEETESGRISRIAIHLRGIEDIDQLDDLLGDYRNDKKFIRDVKNQVRRFRILKRIYEDKVFPIAAGYEYDYKDGFGDARTYGGNRSHEGIDIMCDKGVPVVSVCDGVVEKKGWLELGGWRLGIRDDDGIYYYYAHFSRYHEDIDEGSRVKKGQVIGYAGDSGYGGEGTTGKFAPHLHFGMYEGRNEVAVNPYPFLKVWERSKILVQ